MEGSERQSRSVVVVGIVPKLLKMLHKRLGLLSFPNGKRAVPPTENGGEKKHTHNSSSKTTQHGKRRRHAAAATNSMPQRCCVAVAAQRRWRNTTEWYGVQNKVHLSISEIGGGGVTLLVFIREYFLSSLVWLAARGLKGPKTLEWAKSSLKEIRFWKWQWPKTKSASLAWAWGWVDWGWMGLGASLYLRCGEVSCCCLALDFFANRPSSALGP